MTEELIGRKQIMKALNRSSWNTIINWRKKYKLPIRKHPSNKPMLLVSEYKKWSILYSEMMKK